MSELRFVRLPEVAAADLIDLMTHPKLRAHMPLLGATFTEADAMAFIAGKEALWSEYGFGPWAFLLDERFAGWGGLQPEGGEADLALVLHPTFWGSGGRIVREILRRARSEFGFSSVMVLMPPSRTRLGALSRLGFVPDGETTIYGERFLRFRRTLESEATR
jgi:RimJ/RimL family protein N-acetyltransferase